MDGNVSKTTFSHKFFKLRFSNENTFISIKKLIKYRLYSILDLYLQSLNHAVDRQFFAAALEPKIAVLESTIEPICSDIRVNTVLSTSQSAKIVYRCPITLALASHLKIAPEIIAVNLLKFGDFERDNKTYEFSLNLDVEITKSGWIDFYLPSLSLAIWLQQSILLLQTANILDSNASKVCCLADKSQDWFSAQYIHARCCSLLNLAVREKLIVFPKDEFNYAFWGLSQPRSISWLDAENNLWLKDPSELNTIADLLAIADVFTAESVKWHKLAISFSETVEIFLSECRFLGATNHQYPQQAIARLGLIMLCRYWLAKILVEKLNIAAPTSL